MRFQILKVWNKHTSFTVEPLIRLKANNALLHFSILRYEKRNKAFKSICYGNVRNGNSDYCYRSTQIRSIKTACLSYF